MPGAAATTLDEVPFSSRWKWSGIRREDGWLVLGAPDVLLAGRLPAEVSGHEQEGRRVLAFGRAGVVSPADGGGGTPRIEPLALVVLEERLRDDAARTIAFLYRQDVDVKVMSGDSPATVAAVAARAGIRVAGTPRQGSDLPEDPGQLAVVAREATVFARLTPDHKRALVAALTGHGAYVAMIGDGVNDVPAMKGARLAVARAAAPSWPRASPTACWWPIVSAPSPTPSARAARSSTTCSAWPSCSSPSRCSPPS